MSSPCPTDSELRSFLDGQNSGTHADSVAEHLIGCTHCKEAAISLTSREIVVEAIRSWSRLSMSVDPAPAVAPSQIPTPLSPSLHPLNSQSSLLQPTPADPMTSPARSTTTTTSSNLPRPPKS